MISVSSVVISHCAVLCDIEEKAGEKARQNRRLCGKYGREESEAAIGNSSTDLQPEGVAVDPSKRVIMIPLRPKCGTLPVWDIFHCEI